jgi:hypothetical protein
MPYLSLVPSEQAVRRQLAGFHSGVALKLHFKSGEKVDQILHRFNEYRGPDNQITKLYTKPDLREAFPMAYPLYADVSLYVA